MHSLTLWISTSPWHSSALLFSIYFFFSPSLHSRTVLRLSISSSSSVHSSQRFALSICASAVCRYAHMWMMCNCVTWMSMRQTPSKDRYDGDDNNNTKNIRKILLRFTSMTRRICHGMLTIRFRSFFSCSHQCRLHEKQMQTDVKWNEEKIAMVTTDFSTCSQWNPKSLMIWLFGHMTCHVMSPRTKTKMSENDMPISLHLRSASKWTKNSTENDFRSVTASNSNRLWTLFDFRYQLWSDCGSSVVLRWRNEFSVTVWLRWFVSAIQPSCGMSITHIYMGAFVRWTQLIIIMMPSPPPRDTHTHSEMNL